MSDTKQTANTANVNKPGSSNKQPLSSNDMIPAKAVQDRLNKRKTAQPATPSRILNTGALDEARKEVKAGLELVRQGDTKLGQGTQTIAHGIIALNRNDAFVPTLELNAGYWKKEPVDRNKMKAIAVASLIGDDKPEGGRKQGNEALEYARNLAKWNARKIAIERAVEFAAAISSLSVNGVKFIDSKRVFQVPPVVLCGKDQRPLDANIMIHLDQTTYLLAAKAKDGSWSSATKIKASVDQVVRAAKARHEKTPTTAATRGAGTQVGGNANKTEFALNTVTEALKPTGLLDFTTKMLAILGENPATITDQTIEPLQVIHARLEAFLQDVQKIRASKIARDAATTPGARNLIKQAQENEAKEKAAASA